MIFDRELDIFLRARFTLMVLVTGEEERALQTLKSVCERKKHPCLSWDIAAGFQVVTGGSGTLPTARDPITALEELDKWDGEALFVLKDFHEFWSNEQIKRRLRNVAQKFKYAKKSVLVTSPSNKLPVELKDEAVILDFPPPTERELEAVLNKLTKVPGVRVNLTELGRDKLVRAAVGLTTAQAQRVFAKAIVADGVLDDRDIGLVNEEKKQIIRESQALEFYAVTETLDDVGGLDVLKEWLRLRERAFTQEASEYGLPSPKGVALIGIPGTGKSLTAKMIGGLWRLPLLRLDVGALFGSLVGESEERARRALRVAETVAPCVLWIDELEKALATGGLDGGTSTRVFGTILTWMQEKTSPCFVVATANDISKLPPELLRKGRFDEIFFLDLPTLDEREAIFRVHLKKRHRIEDDFDVARLAEESEGYVGAEIEQAIIEAMYVGFDAKREFSTDDVSLAIKRQVPLSVSQREVIEGLRAWLREGRAQSASFQEVSDAEQQFVPLQLETL
ncbi:MAG: AAA family ATPase [Planctomycetota bacterium]|nr:MAG: AAA family ATPase [Planctomycetota bacterium]REK25964.1 MAG: AAA family ATPase [Planctomycetota bacterium]REK46920.1 MAG: AAA family ATPase [Planctomycetota bacterium]